MEYSSKTNFTDIFWNIYDKQMDKGFNLNFDKETQSRINEVTKKVLKHEAMITVFTFRKKPVASEKAQIEIWDLDYRDLCLKKEDRTFFDDIYDDFFVRFRDHLPKEYRDLPRRIKTGLRTVRYKIEDFCKAMLVALMVIPLALFTLAGIPL